MPRVQIPARPADTINSVEPFRIGVLAVQGNFREHAAMLRSLGAEVVEVRKPEQLDGLDGLVLPGGESTTFTRLMHLYGLDEALRSFGAPVFGTPRLVSSSNSPSTERHRNSPSGIRPLTYG